MQGGDETHGLKGREPVKHEKGKGKREKGKEKNAEAERMVTRATNEIPGETGVRKQRGAAWPTAIN